MIISLLCTIADDDYAIQETQLSLTNRATHLCKCNDVADLTSVIKIRPKNDSSHPAFRGH